MHISQRRQAVADKRGGEEQAQVAGYAALIKGLDAQAPMPARVALVSNGKPKADKGRKFAERDGFALYERNYAVEDTFEGHLNFAMRHEQIDMLALKRIFDKTPPTVMEDYVRGAPSGAIRRQAWWFYETLTGRKLDLPDAPAGTYVDALDADVWHVGKRIGSPRHRVHDNLPGVAGMCALVRRDAIPDRSTRDYVAARMESHVKGLPTSVTDRLTRRLLLKDSRSTFAIERDNPDMHVMQRWSDLVADAGAAPLSLKGLIDLQSFLFKDKRFVMTGVRHGGVWLGDRVDGSPIPTWIGAKPEDLHDLLKDYFKASERMEESGVDPLVVATVLHTCFIQLHPFEDGNGRTARYVLQHALARGGVGGGVTLPVSKAIWSDIDGYHDALRSYDLPRMPLMDWKPTGNGNVEVMNETADLYRYSDMSRQAEFMSRCLERTLDVEVPNELIEMRRRDAAIDQIRDIVELPNDRIERLIAYIRQNGGKLSKAKRKRDFEALHADELEAAEDVVCEVYEIEPPAPTRAPEMDIEAEAAQALTF